MNARPFYDRTRILAQGYVSLGSLGSSMMMLAKQCQLAREQNAPIQAVTAFRISALGEWEAFAKTKEIGTGFKSESILSPSAKTL